MRVLVISRSPWRNDNNTGNTLTDFFKSFEGVEFYSLCMREQSPQNDIAKRNFFISERQMFKHLLNRRTKVGSENFNDTIVGDSEKKFYNFAKKHTNTLLLIAREILWDIGKWKNSNLETYINEVKPDIIFCPVFGCYYPHKILKHLHSLTNAKIVLFYADDNYTLKQFSLSPLYWLYRFGLRKWVRHSASIADMHYCISSVQKKDYDQAFNCQCKILTKSSDFSNDPPLKSTPNSPLQLVFTGNININRWKSLAMLVDVLKSINEKQVIAELKIYTATPLTKKIIKALNVPNASSIMGAVASSEISRIQNDADILVHAEGLDLKSRLMVRQSFSTKIVDYFKAARPIIAVGPKEVASIKHLVDNNCAIVADNRQELYEKLTTILNDAEQLQSYAKRSYVCGYINHSSQQQREMLQCDFVQLLR